MTRHITFGPDVDLDVEEVILPDGRRLTDELAEQIAEDTLSEHRARRAGRPTVTGRAGHTPSLTVRVPAEVRAELEGIAEHQGRRLADVTRDALTEYAERHRAAS